MHSTEVAEETSSHRNVTIRKAESCYAKTVCKEYSPLEPLPLSLAPSPGMVVTYNLSFARLAGICLQDKETIRLTCAPWDEKRGGRVAHAPDAQQ